MDMQEMEKILPPAPPGIEKWIRKEVIKNSYIIYSREKNEAVCTRCGHRFRADRFNMKHNEKGVCPGCKSEGRYKSEGIGRGKLREYFRILLFTHRGNTVYGTLHEVVVSFSEPGLPQISKDMVAVYIFSKDRQEYYRLHYYCHRLWEQVKDIKLPRAPQGAYGMESRFDRTVLYEKNLENVFTKSCLKYLWIPEFFNRYRFNEYDVIRYMALGLRYSSIELLAKAGFGRLVATKVRGYSGSGAVNWRGGSLTKILRLPMGEIRKLPRKMLDFDELRTYRKLEPADRRLPWNVISTVAHTLAVEVKRIEDIGTVDFMTWVKATEGNISTWDWCDYIKDCKLLGMDIRKKNILFPDNFQETHAELSQRVKVAEDELKAAGMKRTAESFGMDISSDLFILKIAQSQKELNCESSALNHCVRTYGDKVSRGETVIYFIRRKDEPDKPFYTLEIKPDGTFIQCRGEYNCSMTEEVKDFTEKVVKEFKRMIKKKARDAA